MSDFLIGLISFILGGFFGMMIMACFKTNKGDE